MEDATEKMNEMTDELETLRDNIAIYKGKSALTIKKFFKILILIVITILLLFFIIYRQIRAIGTRKQSTFNSD